MASRVREFYLPLTAVFAGSALISLIACAVMAFGGVELGLNLSLVGLLLGLLLPLGIEIRNRAGRVRKVHIIDYRVHQYGHAVGRGVIRTLQADKRRWATEYVGPDELDTADEAQWQIRQIQEAVLEDVDAIVLVPCGDDRPLWFATASAIKARTFVVAVDTKPPNRVFRDVGIEPPRFVSSNYPETGVIVGDLLVDWMQNDPSRTCVLWTGPAGSWPGEERSRNVIYKLASAELLDRTVLIPISSWAPDADRCRDTLAIVEDADGEVGIYTADDENAVALHLLTLSDYPGLRNKMYVVGCNGTADDWGNVPSMDTRAVDATVSILAEQQGVEVANLLIKERHSRLSPSERSVYIKPNPLLRLDYGRRWIDRIFDDSSKDEIVENLGEAPSDIDSEETNP